LGSNCRTIKKKEEKEREREKEEKAGRSWAQWCML
jgi:hypothetical protein